MAQEGMEQEHAVNVTEQANYLVKYAMEQAKQPVLNVPEKANLIAPSVVAQDRDNENVKTVEVRATSINSKFEI